MKATLALVLICTVASACGGSPRLSREQYVSSMRALHSSELREAVRHWPALVCRRVVSRREWLVEVRRARRAARPWTRRLAALRPPAALAKPHTQYVAFVRADQRYLGRLYRAVARDDLTPAQANAKVTYPPRRLVRLLFRAVDAFGRAGADVFGESASGWTVRPPKARGC